MYYKTDSHPLFPKTIACLNLNKLHLKSSQDKLYAIEKHKYIDFFWLKSHHKQEIIIIIVYYARTKLKREDKKVGGEEITAGTADRISLNILL